MAFRRFPGLRNAASSLRECRYPAILFVLSFAGFLLARGVAIWGKGPAAQLRWDATWYRTIIERGYYTNGNPYVEHNVVFFPLYPMTCRLVKALLPLDTALVMLLVSAAATLLGLILLYKVLLRHSTPFTARASLALLAFHPFAVFFYNGFTESLFLLLISAFFYFLLNRDWPWAAAIVVGLASAVRPYGCLLSLVFAFELLRRHYRSYGFHFDSTSSFLKQALLLLPVCFVGLMAYTAWLGYKFDEPMAFSHNMAPWDSGGLEQPINWVNLLTFKHVGVAFLFALATQPLTSPAMTGLCLFIIAPLLLLAGYRKIHPAFSFFLLLMFSFFHFMDHHDMTRLINAGRHLMVVFPLAMLLATFLNPAQVDRFLVPWIGREPADQPCACWRFICTLPLFAVIMVFGWLYLHNIVGFFHGEFI